MPTGLLTRLRTSWQDSTCTISRPSVATWDGDEYAETATQVYSGACHVRPMQTEQRVVQAGDRAVSLRSYLVEVPASVPVRIDDTVTVGASSDSEAVGMTLRVLDAPKNDLVTVRVLECVEQT